ncbi:MAG: hypothetical protein HUJ69_04045 [Lachnospiraceae bacterium]|nr:hypothetical protein [Lachnospiraceae bacterium]
MSSYIKQIESIIEQEPENELLEASVLYRQELSTIPEASYYKTLGRMCKQGKLVHLSKGLYYRPMISRYGTVPISDAEIIRHYTQEGTGIVIGYPLYNRIGLTTQISKRVEVLSSNLTEQTKNVGNICVSSCFLEFNDESTPIIESLEVLQNYSKIEDINKEALAAYMTRFAKLYSDKTAVQVLQTRKYKKSTIAFLERFLNYHGIENTLNQFLSALSSYSLPEMEEFYETT